MPLNGVNLPAFQFSIHETACLYFCFFSILFDFISGLHHRRKGVQSWEL
jgi:hypothetical protein